MNPKAAIPAVAVVATAAFLAGRYSSGSVEKPADKTAPAITVSSTSRSNSGSNERSGQSLAENANREARSSGFGLAAQKAKLEELLRNPDAIERNRAFLNYLDRLSPGEFEQLAAHFQELGMAEERNGEFTLLLGAWAKADAVGALTYAEDTLNDDSATNTILSTWAMQDPEGAIRWAEAHHDGDDANPYLVGIIQGLASQDPERATQLLKNMPFSEERGAALAGLLPSILARGPEAAKDWAKGITDEQLRDGVISRMATHFAQTDPASAAEWLKTTSPEGALRSMDDVLGTWVNKDKDAAKAYYENMPAGELRSTAMRGMVTAMAEKSPQEALAFMDSHQRDVNDRVVQQFLWNSFDKEPALSLNNVGRLGNPEQQQRFYNRMLDAWMRRDLSAAENWASTANLPPASRQHFQQRLAAMRASKR